MRRPSIASRIRPPIARILLTAFASLSVLTARAQEGLDGPWATINGDNAGTQATTAIPYTFGVGPVEEAWRLDVRAAGHDRVAGRNPITFDSEGNIYWKSSIGGGTGGLPRVVSVSPEGEIRWAGSDDGELHTLGAYFDGTAAVVGERAVYALGVDDTLGLPELFLAAYDRATGELLWRSDLEDAVAAVDGSAATLLTPVLHEGKVYVVAPDVSTGLPSNVYRVDVEEGEPDWFERVEGVDGLAGGQITLVPDIFGVGQHGLYWCGDSGGAADAAGVWAVRVDEEGAELAWAAEGGKVARSHLVWSEETSFLYAATWTDYGGELYTYDPIIGLVEVNQNSADTGHGFYDVTALDFNGTDIIAGGFQGLVIRYSDEGSGATTDSIAFDDEGLSDGFFGEYRVYGQLLRSPEGASVLIAGTNSNTDFDPAFTARVVAIDVTSGELLWEHDTGIEQNHGFTVRGGPAMGPDGKVYWFDAVTGELVALRGPEPVDRSLFIRGDADCTGLLNLTDAIYCFNYLFLGGRPPCCDEVGDANDDDNTDISDGVYILNFLFNGGPEPAAPFPDCGVDPNGAECEAYEACEV